MSKKYATGSSFYPDLLFKPVSVFGVLESTAVLPRSFSSAVSGPRIYSVILEPMEYGKSSDKPLG